jgi:hypothetical protein
MFCVLVYSENNITREYACTQCEHNHVCLYGQVGMHSTRAYTPRLPVLLCLNGWQL